MFEDSFGRIVRLLSGAQFSCERESNDEGRTRTIEGGCDRDPGAAILEESDEVDLSAYRYRGDVPP